MADICKMFLCLRIPASNKMFCRKPAVAPYFITSVWFPSWLGLLTVGRGGKEGLHRQHPALSWYSSPPGQFGALLQVLQPCD